MHRKLPIARTLIVVLTLFLTASSLTFANFSNQSTQEQSLTKKGPVSKPARHTTPKPTQSKSTPAPTIAIPNTSPITPTTHTPPIPSTSSPPTPTPILTAPPASSGSSFINEINNYRQSQGLGPVQESSETCAFAATRAQETATNFSHDGFNTRVSSKTLPYAKWSSVTENIAMTSNQQDVVNMWINSPGHAANMRADTPYVCVAQNGNYFAYEGMKP